jgi:hypothetical protein
LLFAFAKWGIGKIPDDGDCELALRHECTAT